ncbi:hypothetical protein GQ600_12678 [Phytophthora cactorum]|nr:hypothetical protein GQ600_12678 [Phytophthora cactorum]
MSKTNRRRTKKRRYPSKTRSSESCIPTSNDPLAAEYLMLKKQDVLKRLRLEASEEPSARAGSLITSGNTGTDTSSNTDIIDYSSNVTAQQAVDTSTHTLAVTSSEAESAAISESDITTAQ